MNVKAYLSRMLINGGVLVRFPGVSFLVTGGAARRKATDCRDTQTPVFETARSLPMHT